MTLTFRFEPGGDNLPTEEGWYLVELTEGTINRATHGKIYDVDFCRIKWPMRPEEGCEWLNYYSHNISRWAPMPTVGEEVQP